MYSSVGDSKSGKILVIIFAIFGMKREKMDLVFGAATKYFHDHLKVPHGFICENTVYVT
jgi:hypothetical protein